MHLEWLQKFHEETLSLIDEITPLLIPHQLDPVKMAQYVSIVYSKLNMYFEFLLPEFQNLTHPAIQKIGIKYSTQTINFLILVKNYKDQWSDSLEITNHPLAFCHDTRNLFAVLKTGIALEIKELYPLLRNE